MLPSLSSAATSLFTPSSLHENTAQFNTPRPNLHLRNYPPLGMYLFFLTTNGIGAPCTLQFLNRDGNRSITVPAYLMSDGRRHIRNSRSVCVRIPQVRAQRKEKKLL